MNSRDPADSEIANAVSNVISKFDIDKLTYGRVEKFLEAIFVIPLAHRKSYIRKLIDENVHKRIVSEREEISSENKLSLLVLESHLEKHSVYDFDNNGKRVKQLNHLKSDQLDQSHSDSFNNPVAFVVQNIATTCNDTRYEIENVFGLADNLNKFWVSTGMFPHKINISFGKPVSLREINLCRHNIKHLTVKSLTQEVLVNEFHFQDEGLQTSRIFTDLPCATAVDITINSAYSDFCLIGHMALQGAVMN